MPIQYSAAGLDEAVLRAFGMEPGPAPDLRRWHDIVDALENPEGEVTIGVVGKYVGLPDAYKSLHEALVHGGIANRVKVNIRWIDAELFERDDEDIAAKLEPCHAILVPGAFGSRGAEGKIASVRFARTIRCATVASGTRNARAIAGVVRPPSARSVSATRASSLRAGWQQVNISASNSSPTASSAAAAKSTPSMASMIPISCATSSRLRS